MRKVVLILLYLTGIQYTIGLTGEFMNDTELNIFSLLMLIGIVLFFISTYLFQKKEVMQIPIIILLAIEIIYLLILMISNPEVFFDFFGMLAIGITLLIDILLCVYLFRSRTYLML